VHDPPRGPRGQARQRQVTDHESATRPTAHGVIQGEKGQAWVEATQHVIVPAEACGHGPAEGPVAPRVAGAKATLQAIGWPEAAWAGPLLSADRQDQREANRQPCAPAQLEADRPDPHGRHREPRVASQERPTRPTAEPVTWAALTSDTAPACALGPQGNVRTREARRPQRGNHRYRREEASAADCTVCPRREPCVQTAATRRTPLAVWVANAQDTWSQQRIANIDPPAARQRSGVRLAMVEPVGGNMRSQPRWDRLTWRGQIKGNRQGRRYGRVHTLETLVNDGLAV